MRQMALVTTATLLIMCAGAALGQGTTASLQGTVTFRDGRTITGDIRMAELGVVPGSGIGSLLPGGGYFAVKVGGTDVKVTAQELAVMEALWENTGTADRPNWVVTQLTITRKNGTQVTGPPAWPPIHASSVDIGNQQVYAFPLSGVDFSPDNFLVKVDLGGAAPPTPPVAQPAAPTIAPVTEPAAPTATPVDMPPPTVPPLPAPAAPAGSSETPAVPTVTLAPTVQTEPGVGGLGKGTMEILVKCPDCGKLMRVVVQVSADAVK